MVRTYTDIKEMVLTIIEIERVVGDPRATPYDPLREEKDENTTRESFTHK